MFLCSCFGFIFKPEPQDKPFLSIATVLIEAIFSSLITVTKKKNPKKPQECGKLVVTSLLTIKSHRIKRVTSMSSAAILGSRPLLPPASKRGHDSKLACTVRAGEQPWTGGESRVLGPSSPGCFWLCYRLGEHERAACGSEAESLCWHRSPASHSAPGLLWLHRGFARQVVPDAPRHFAGLAGASWACRSVQKSSDLLVFQVNCKICLFPLDSGKGGKIPEQ